MAGLKIDVTCTAMPRPKIVEKTFKSFSKNLQYLDFKKQTLYMNVDPLPGFENARKEVVEMAKEYFGEVVVNLPRVPNYTSAYNWVWSKAKTKFILNLEDDWGLLRPVDVRILLKYFTVNPKLMEVALRAYSYYYSACPTSPSIMHQRYYKAVGGKLNPKFNPECQLRGKNFGIEMPARSLGVSPKGKIIAYPEKGTDIIVKDLGRGWIKKSPFKRPNVSKKNFTSWIIEDTKYNDDLTIIADKLKSDKGNKKHRYTKLYDNYFNDLRYEQLHLIEMGVADGTSMRMWLTYFQNGKVFGLDNRNIKENKYLVKQIATKRFNFTKGNQGSGKKLQAIINKADGILNIVIDDCCHRSEERLFSLNFLWPYLQSGGIYIIENLHHIRGLDKTYFTAPAINPVEVIKEYIKTGNFNTDGFLTDEEDKLIASQIKTCEMYKDKIVFITKK